MFSLRCTVINIHWTMCPIFIGQINTQKPTEIQTGTETQTHTDTHRHTQTQSNYFDILISFCPTKYGLSVPTVPALPTLWTRVCVPVCVSVCVCACVYLCVCVVVYVYMFVFFVFVCVFLCVSVYLCFCV